MGSPNFSQSDYPTLGLVFDVDTSHEAIASYRAGNEHLANLSDELVLDYMYEIEQDLIADYSRDAENLASCINYYISVNQTINPLSKFNSELNLYYIAHEEGYHHGFRLAITTSFNDSWNTPELCYDNYIHWRTIPASITYEQFKNCCEKLEHFLIYTMQQLDKDSPLYGVSGGWSGGGYTLDENTPSDHEKFSGEYKKMLAYIKGNYEFVCW